MTATRNDEHVAGQVDAAAQAGQHQGEQRREHHRQRVAGQPAPQRSGRRGRAAAPGRGPSARASRCARRCRRSRGSSALPTPGPVSSADSQDRRLDAEHELGGVLGPGEGQQGLGHVVADDLVVGAAQRLDQPPLRGQRGRVRRRSARPTWSRARRAGRRRPTGRRSGRPAGSACRPPGPPVSATTTRSRASQVPWMSCAARYRCRPSSTLSASQSRASSRSAVRLPARK